MKILVITPAYPIVDRVDLIQDTTAIHYFTKWWVKAGHDVNVFHFHLHTTLNIMRYPSVLFKKVTPSKLDGVSIFMSEHRFFSKQKKINQFQKDRAIKKYNEILNQSSPPDIVVVHMPTELDGIIENLNFNCPKIAVFHNTDLKKINKNLVNHNKVFEFYDGYGYRSKVLKEQLVKRFPSNKQNFIVNSGAPQLEFIPIIRRKPTDKYKILFVGKLIPSKGIKTVMRALASSDLDFQFNIIGEGPDESKLKTYADELDIFQNVTFIGKLTREKVVAYMHDSDIFVMVSSPETFGLVYIEAMATGCLTIGTINEGIDGIIENNVNGFLNHFNDDESLRRLFNKIKNLSEEKYMEISTKAMETSAKLSEQKVAMNYLDFIKRVNDK